MIYSVCFTPRVVSNSYCRSIPTIQHGVSLLVANNVLNGLDGDLGIRHGVEGRNVLVLSRQSPFLAGEPIRLQELVTLHNHQVSTVSTFNNSSFFSMNLAYRSSPTIPS